MAYFSRVPYHVRATHATSRATRARGVLALLFALAGVVSGCRDWDRFEPLDVAPAPPCGDAGQACCSASPACGANLGCVAGTCGACSGSMTACEGQCVDTRSDRNHCGRCGNRCRGSDRCNNGDCD